MAVSFNFCCITLFSVTVYAARDIQTDIRLLQAREVLLNVFRYLVYLHNRKQIEQ